MNFYLTDPDVIFLLVLLEIWAQTEKFLHSCHIYRTYHLGPMLALILKCCPVTKHTHKPGYDEKIVVKNYKKMHLRFLIHLFWFPHPYLMICYVNLGFGIHMKRIKMLVAWWLTLFLWSTFRPQRNSQWKKYWSWRRLKVFFRFLMWYHVHVAWELLAILDLMCGKRVFPCWSAVFPGSFCSLKWVTKVLHQKPTCDCFGCMFVCKYSPTSVGTAWWNWK